MSLSIFTTPQQQKLAESGLIEQRREELWETQDKETTDLITKSRLGKSKPVSFDTFREKHRL